MRLPAGVVLGVIEEAWRVLWRRGRYGPIGGLHDDGSDFGGRCELMDEREFDFDRMFASMSGCVELHTVYLGGDAVAQLKICFESGL